VGALNVPWDFVFVVVCCAVERRTLEGKMLNSELIETPRLTLVPQTVEQVRAMIVGMSAADRAEVSPAWLAMLDDPTVSAWTLGFSLVERESGAEVGTAGFKGPPADGIVELAYSVETALQGRGYATEAAAALANLALESGEVSVVWAHTLPGPNGSTRVLEKCGFRCWGEVSDPEDGVVWRWGKDRGASTSGSS
jgi:[ribosomal protein S5]-alanine N-acetyltransferase